jgi:uncharacterized protein (DUF58 family)
MAAAPLFLGGALYPPLTGIGVIYLGALALCAAMDAALLPSRRNLTIERMLPRRVSLNEPARVVFRIRNGSRRRLAFLLAEDLPEKLSAQPPSCAVRLDGRSSGTAEYRLVAHRRGRHSLSDVDIRVLPTGGLFYRQFRLRLPADVEVFPDMVNVKRYEIQLRRGLYEWGVSRLRHIGQGTEIESLRPFGQGDDMSRVDWKATAKWNSLIVRNYEPERQQNILLAIDVGRATAGEFRGMSRLDYFVNAALMLAYVALRQGDRFSLLAVGQEIESYLPPVRGVQSLDQVARALYQLEPSLAQTDYGAACRFIGLKSRKRSMICLMTDVIDRDANADLVGYLARFARYHLALAITLDDTDVRAVAEAPLARAADPYEKAVALDVIAARDEVLQTMRQSGVSVINVAPDALTPELINRYLLIKSTRRL